MKNDTVIKTEGMRVLTEQLGILEAERFIALILREPFDYTEWQRSLFDDISLDVFLKSAMEFRRHKNIVEKFPKHKKEPSD